MPNTVISISRSRDLYSAPYTHTGVQKLVQWIMDTQGIGQFELSKRSGLSPAAIYQILTKTEKDVTRPPRRSTVSALAHVVGANVAFDSRTNKFALIQTIDLKRIPPNHEFSLLVSQIASILMGQLIRTGKKKFTKEERERIVRVVKAVVQ